MGVEKELSISQWSKGEGVQTGVDDFRVPRATDANWTEGREGIECESIESDS